MKNFYFLFLYSSLCLSQFNYNKEWSTYYFGSVSSASSSAIDSQGNIIVVGAIGQAIYGIFPTEYEPSSYYDQWTTPNAHQPSVNNDNGDGFITKFSPDGTVIWSTYFGGVDSEFIHQVEVDSNDNIYVKGFTFSSTGFATTGAYITDYNSIVSEDSYSSKDFLAKFSSNGTLQWCTYLPTSLTGNYSSLKRMCIGTNDNIYITGETMIDNANIVTPGAFQTNFITYLDNFNLKINAYLQQFDGQGNRVAGTYCGAKVNPLGLASDSEGNIILIGYQNAGSSDVLSSTTSYQPDRGSAYRVGFISKFSSDLATRQWSTYYGTPNNNSVINVATLGTAIYCIAYSEGLPPDSFATPGTFSQVPTRCNMVKFTGEGSRVWGTFAPYSSDGDGIYSQCNNFVIKNDKLYIVGYTYTTTGIATTGSYQENYSGSNSIHDSYFIQFSTDGTRNWGSYFGGERIDSINDISVLDDTTFYLCGGARSSTLIATAGSIQPQINSGSSPEENTSNMFLAKFAPVLATDGFAKSNLQIAPNPSNGKFVLTGSINITQEDVSLVIYDNLGRVIASQKVANSSAIFQQEYDFSNVLSKGIYFAKLFSGKESVQTFKVLVK